MKKNGQGNPKESQTTIAQDRFTQIAFWQLVIGYKITTALSGCYTRPSLGAHPESFGIVLASTDLPGMFCALERYGSEEGSLL